MANWVRRDGTVILLFVVAVVVMTYPLAFRAADGLPSKRGDTFAALWQKWWLGEVVRHGYDPNFAHLLRHPTGLDTTFQPHPWTALGTWYPLSLFFGEIVGYNLNFMLGLLVSAYAAYLLVLHLTRHRAAAWVGGAFFAFYPAHLLTAMFQPHTGSTQWLPVFMLALVVGLDRIASADASPTLLSRRSAATMLLAALALSINIYITVKPWMLAVLLGGLYVLLGALANGWWRRVAFWKALGLLGACSLLLALPILVPYLRAEQDLGYAIELTVDRLKLDGADLASYVRASPELPFFMPHSLAHLLDIPYRFWLKRNGYSFYLGLTSIALAALGVWHAIRRDRRRLLWLLMALLLWGLSLGTRLSIDLVEFREAWTPYQLVQHISLFRAFRTPNRFALAFSLPWAILVGFGVAFLWRRLARRPWLPPVITTLLTLLMFFEITEVPIVQYPIVVSPFFDQLRAENGPGAIINVPGGKRTMYQQTIHGRPIAGGSMGRPPAGYDAYVRANPVLDGLWEKERLSCDFDLDQAIDQLRIDGFEYVIVHKQEVLNKKGRIPRWVYTYAWEVEPHYEDDAIIVYTLDALRSTGWCDRKKDGADSNG